MDINKAVQGALHYKEGKKRSWKFGHGNPPENIWNRGWFADSL